MKPVILTIKGKQINLEGEENNIEMITEGKFYKKNEVYYIVYDESEITGMEGSITTLKIQGKKVSLKRFGNNNSKLTFEKGKSHISEYDTLYGFMPIEIVTSNVEIDISDSGIGRIKLAYTLDISGVLESRNKLLIEMN